MVPDPEVMPEWAKKKGIIGTYKDLCKNTVGVPSHKHLFYIINLRIVLVIIDAENFKDEYVFC